MTVMVWVGIGLLGGVGSLLRFVVDRSIARHATATFPLGTLLVNVSGAFLLGAVSSSNLGTTSALLLGGATIGSYTTFSTWMFESHRLGEDGRKALMVANLSLTLLLGFLACALGRYLGGAR